jgi:hypothetical protein
MGSLLGSIAGPVVGGLLGGQSSRQTASKEPWKPAIKPLTDSLATGQRLENYYQQNPFNPLQQQAYQNIFGDLDMLRGQIAPEMFGFANQMMNSNYQRGPRNSQVERGQPMGGGMGQPANMRGAAPAQASGGLQQAMGMVPMAQLGNISGSISDAMGGRGSMGYENSDPGMAAITSQMASPMGGDLTGAGSMMRGAFPELARSAAVMPAMGGGGAYGALDFTQLNPFTANGGVAMKPPEAPPAAAGPADKEMERWQREQYENWLMDQRSGN